MTPQEPPDCRDCQDASKAAAAASRWRRRQAAALLLRILATGRPQDRDASTLAIVPEGATDG